MYGGGRLIGKTDLSDKRHLINKQPPQTETPGPRHFRLLSPSAIWRRNTSCLSSLPEDGRNTFQSFYEARDTLNQKIHKSTPRKENYKFPPLFFHYSYGVRGEGARGACGRRACLLMCKGQGGFSGRVPRSLAVLWPWDRAFHWKVVISPPLAVPLALGIHLSSSKLGLRLRTAMPGF